MFTEIFHSTTLNKFKKIQEFKKIISRKILNVDANSCLLPSHKNLVYFSCNEQHNLDYIEADNILEDNDSCFLEIGDIHNLVQIKICISYEQLSDFNLIMRYDEDSFLKSSLGSIVDESIPFSLYYNVNYFNSEKCKYANPNLTKKILNFLPNSKFGLGSKEYKENVDFIIFSNNSKFCNLMEKYYTENPPLTCALENEVDLNLLKRGGIKIFYRHIQAIGIEKIINCSSATNISLHINNKGEWLSI